MVKAFKTPKSKFIIAITFIISIVLILIIVRFCNQIILDSSSYMTIIYFMLIGIIICVICFSIYFSLKKIILYETFVEIHYIGYKQRFELTQIESISLLKKLPPFFIGTQGFWGFNGKINSDIITSVNSLDNMVLISTDKKKFIVSVENPSLFIKEIKNSIK